MTVLGLSRSTALPRISADGWEFLRWIGVWLILCNLPFMAMWVVGGPPRWVEIVSVGIIGLLVKRMPFFIQAVAFIGSVAFCALAFIGGLFNLSITQLAFSMQFFGELNPASSVEYVAVFLLLLTVMLAGLYLLRRGVNFANAWLILLAAALVATLAYTDESIRYGMRGHYKRLAPMDAAFDSAAGQTQFFAGADGKRHLLLVMVESLGVPASDPDMKARMFAAFKNSAVAERYDLTTGSNLFYVSTTSGEVRELCGNWDDYYRYMDGPDGDCMPARLAAKGYATQAVHSFKGFFFERESWYPHIGFQKSEFFEQLKEQGLSDCGGVFSGVCDREVPAILADRLKKAKQPTFLYWLTVNTHLPIAEGLNLQTENCAAYAPELQRKWPMICRQFKIFDDIDRALAKEITAPDFPPTDILIVGDHIPPFFDRSTRLQFDPAHVPYLYLKAKPRDAEEERENRVDPRTIAARDAPTKASPDSL